MPALCPLCLGQEESYFWRWCNMCWNQSPMLTWDAAVPQTQLSVRARGFSGCSVQMDILYEITSHIFSLALQTAVRLAWAGGSELAQDMAVDVDINLAEHICTWEWSLAEEIFLLTRCDFAWAVSHPLLAATSLLWKATEVCSLPNSTVFIPQLPHPQCITDIKNQYLIYLCYM